MLRFLQSLLSVDVKGCETQVLIPLTSILESHCLAWLFGCWSRYLPALTFSQLCLPIVSCLFYDDLRSCSGVIATSISWNSLCWKPLSILLRGASSPTLQLFNCRMTGRRISYSIIPPHWCLVTAAFVSANMMCALAFGLPLAYRLDWSEERTINQSWTLIRPFYIFCCLIVRKHPSFQYFLGSSYYNIQSLCSALV